MSIGFSYTWVTPFAKAYFLNAGVANAVNNTKTGSFVRWLIVYDA